MRQVRSTGRTVPVLIRTNYPEGLHGVLPKGASMGDVWGELAALSAFAVVLLTVSVRRFSKTLD